MSTNVPVRRYKIDADYSSLIEEGGEWYRASDIDAERDGMADAHRQQIEAMRSTRDGVLRELQAVSVERDSLRADAERLKPYLQHKGCHEYVAGVRQCYCGLDSALKEQKL